MTRGLEIMLAELESNCLCVVLVPSKRFVNEGGMIRVAASKNATWYRKFCAANTSDRRRKNSAVDTRIKRQSIIYTLNSLIAGKSRSKYAPDLLKLAARFQQSAA